MTSRFDPTEVIGPGRTVVEASAGTGKTFTIAALVARLVAAEDVPIDRILVVTFTRAATAELRARVRRRLVSTVSAVDAVGIGVTRPHDGNDEHLDALLRDVAPDLIRMRLSQALTDFDRAHIFTIDSFAQRLMGELGFGSRLSADAEPGSVERRQVAETAADLIIGRFATDEGMQPPPIEHVHQIGAGVLAVPDAEIVPRVDEIDGVPRVRVELAHLMRTEMRRRLRLNGHVTFDDGLAEVWDALSDSAIGPGVRSLLAGRYEIALIDEAQDTDPLQWRVLRAVFEESRLVVIGDPKQSIYSFRGADVSSYLEAADGATRRTLDTNFRSDGPLLEGMDVLFNGTTFGDNRIEYVRLDPSEGHRDARISGVEASLSMRWLGGDLGLPRRHDGLFYVDDVRRTVSADAAAVTVEMLSSDVSVPDSYRGARPLRPSDVAVLCRTAAQVEMVRGELDTRHVPSVAGRSGAVFTSDAAEQWRRFLMAVEHPERMDRVRLGATTVLMGMGLAEVAALDDEADLDLQTRMRGLGRLLRDVGVPALLAEADRSTGLTARVLAGPDGERFMTDLTHVAEELHSAWRPGRIGSLVGWLEGVMSESDQRAKERGEEPESRQRRLETDAEAVQVLTIHGAKGLEFPVVLAPFAWDQPSWKPTIPVFHDPERPGVRQIDVGGDYEGSDFRRHVELAMSEEAAEEARLLYVALTRARHHLVVWWVKDAPGAQQSQFGRLLDRDGWKGAARSAPQGVIGQVGRTEIPPLVRYQPAGRTGHVLATAMFDRPLDHLWRRASFSSLAPEHPVSQSGEEAEAWADEIVADDEEVVVAPELLMADLPRGARFGILVHDVFESVAFDDPDLEASIRQSLEMAMRRELWEFDAENFVAGMVAAMTTPLGPDPHSPTLAQIGRVLKELVFELPVRTSAGPVSLADIGTVMARHLPADDPFHRYAGRLGMVDDQRFRGFLTGAIDLTMVLPDGRWVVMDYKSNALSSYDAAGLASAMIDGNYVLQSTFYQVALHRYLRWRLPRYEPDRHLGGSIYLFLRGTSGPDTPVVDDVRSGVQVWNPPAQMIVALSDLFEGKMP